MESDARKWEQLCGQPGRLVSIDVLRAAGALLVLGYHNFFGPIASTPQLMRSAPWAVYPLLQGYVGVHLFLVVSGFCIHTSVARKGVDSNPEFFSFWARRLRRLYPPYLAALLLAVACLAARSVLEHGWGARAWYAMAPRGAAAFLLTGAIHLFLLFPLWPRSFLYAYGIGVAWTLALEEQLYAMYFLLPALRRRLGMEGMVLAVLAVTVAWRIAALFGPLGHNTPMMAGPSVQWVGQFPAAHLRWWQQVDWITMGPARWFEWMLGALAAEIALGRSKLRPIYTSVPLAVVAASAALLCQWSRVGWVITDALWGASFFVAVNCFVAAERAGKLKWGGWVKWAAAVGQFSYSLYLIHTPFGRLFQTMLSRVLPWRVTLPVALGMVLGAAWLFYRLVELPAIRWSRQVRLRVEHSGAPS